MPGRTPAATDVTSRHDESETIEEKDMSVRFTATSTHAIEGQTCAIARRLKFEPACSSVVNDIQSTMGRLAKSYDIEQEDLPTPAEASAMRRALRDYGRLTLVEGTELPVEGIAPERIQRFAWILNTEYAVDLSVF
jgi:hypothetical protein